MKPFLGKNSTEASSREKRSILTMASLTKDVHRPTIRASALVFEDPSSRELKAHLERVAPSSANILIIGETGTGKELVARFVHQASERSAGPFVAVNCGTFVETLVEAELFGHEKGAFTGASRAKPGWFEAANGGTIFLDEIGDLAPGLQVKLLRVLQEREVVRVGARQPLPIDVRVIAATNIDLEQAVQLGRFRQDLFYRLNVAQIDLRPLRERPGDIMPLVEHFLAVYGHPETRLSREAARLLLSYSWPGNIRELENAIHHAVLIAEGGEIGPRDLSLSRHRQHHATTPAASEDSLQSIFLRLFEEAPSALYDQVSDKLIRSALDYCEGNQVQTARLLGISRNILRAHLARLGIIAPTRRRSTETEAR